jgi:hypothetical protein
VKKHTLIALALSGVGLLVLIATLARTGSVRSYIADNYRFVGTQAVRGDRDRTRVYASRRSVVDTAADIADARRPADRRTDVAGVFLRYQNDMIAVVPHPRGGGSRIMVDDEDTGYRHYFGHVGGWWGTYSGPAERFRGGGPGGGK